MVNENENQVNSGFNIVAISLKTVMYFVAFVSLLCTCVFMSNPYFAMKTSYDLGFQKNAYAYARTYLERSNKNLDLSNVKYDSKYVNVLIYSMELGEKFLDKKTAYHLQKDVITYSKIIDISKRNEMLDSYYYKNSAPSMQVAVYSYENYVGQLFAKASTILNDSNFILDGQVISQNQISEKIENTDLTQKQQLFDFAVILNQISVYQSAGMPLSEVMPTFTSKFNDYVQNSLAYNTDDLFRLFLVKSAVEICEIKKNDGGVFAQMVGEKTLSDYYYKVLLYNYIVS